jgi:O-antigen/teichoic acid export membrane protein
MLAAGWTRLPLVINLIAVAVLIPLLTLLSMQLGTMGGAIAWLTYNIGVVLIGVPIMHRRVLSGHARRWFLNDVGAPLLGAIVAAVVVRVAIGEPTSRAGMLLLFIAAVCACGLAAWLFSPARSSLMHGVARILGLATRFSVKP